MLKIISTCLVLTQHPYPGLASRTVVLGKRKVYMDIIKKDAFTCQRLHDPLVGNLKRFLGKRGSTHPILVAHHRNMELA